MGTRGYKIVWEHSSYRVAKAEVGKDIGKNVVCRRQVSKEKFLERNCNGGLRSEIPLES